jgi:hypothetical protein
MMSTKEKELIESIKGLMKMHGLTSYDIGIIDSQIGKIKITPKWWLRLLVPIKGYYYDDFEVYKIMHLDDELYFIVKKEHQTYEVPYKKEFFRYTWDELVNMVKTTKWSKRNWGFGGKDHNDWETNKLRSIESSLRYYDAHEEIKEKLSESQIRILCKNVDNETSFLEKAVDKIFLGY